MEPIAQQEIPHEVIKELGAIIRISHCSHSNFPSEKVAISCRIDCRVVGKCPDVTNV